MKSKACGVESIFPDVWELAETVIRENGFLMNQPNALEDVMCCPNCFQHEWLRDFVRGQSSKRGACHFCGGHHVRLLSVEQLIEPFRNLLSEYVHELYRGEEIGAPGGHHWAACELLIALQEDWHVFSSALIESTKAGNLLGSILSRADTQDSRLALAPDSWVLRFSRQARRNELRFFDRMFPSDGLEPPSMLIHVQEQIDVLGTRENQVGNHLSYYAELLQRNSLYFRARPGCETAQGQPVAHSDMGANPIHPGSRANTNGQYALYLSETESTAVAEVRQAVGSMVSVGQVSASRDLTVVDLCLAVGSLNPFVTKNLPWMLDLSYLLASIARLMSKPAETGEDYFRTQHLANIARAVGYDGMRYPSALNSSERNVVLFARDSVQKRASWVNLVSDLGFARM